jgi:hypothetical protein
VVAVQTMMSTPIGRILSASGDRRGRSSSIGSRSEDGRLGPVSVITIRIRRATGLDRRLAQDEADDEDNRQKDEAHDTQAKGNEHEKKYQAHDGVTVG